MAIVRMALEEELNEQSAFNLVIHEIFKYFLTFIYRHNLKAELSNEISNVFQIKKFLK